jgi:hypothetical protein
MAAPGVTVKRAERALQQIVESVLALAERLQIDPVAIPTQGRDLNYLHADQLEAIAENLTRLLVATESAPIAISATETVTDTADGDTMRVRAEDGAYVQDLPDESAPDEDLNQLTKAQLVDRLVALGVSGYNKDDYRKDELIAFVQRELRNTGKG